MHDAIQREARVYREIRPLIARWAPALYGEVNLGEWRALLLEDLGPKSAPPWTRALARRVMHAYAEFHNATRGAVLPDWLVRPEWRGWPRDIDLEDAAGRRWLAGAAPVLAKAGEYEGSGRRVLLHDDTRSDNLRWVRGRLYLVDWPFAGAGEPELDLVAFAQSITVDGGPAPEELLAWYGERGEVVPAAVDAALVGAAGFFLRNAFRPDLPGLPRLRAFQRAQLRATLAWTARRLDLPPPTWLARQT